ncbi:hypothetical protein [Nocardiopsis sp. JB363]|uniref:hypothetical protein n=1 Tax=Nocardiopsis sp. JB363 TaxID=1434837 RepID=UPI00097A8862|nr:hypothetical protein [Nocardiopsis sp. JB363]SIO86464.1 hypothetical protein BQ8420_12135 [Nocardiopsis sp. JB363]
MATKIEQSRHYEDMSTLQLQQAHARLLRAREELRQDLEGVLGPDETGPDQVAAARAEIAHVAALLRPMTPFIHGAVRPWPAGEERLHLYALTDVCGDHCCEGGPLVDEIDRQGQILPGHRDLITPVPERWRHITIGRVNQATEDEAGRLADALSQWVDRLTAPPVKALMVPTVTEHGVLLDEGLPDPWRRPPGWSWESSLEGVAALLRTAARVADIQGPDTPTRVHTPRSFHLATAYCHTAGTGRALADRIGRTRPTIPVHVRTLALVWVSQDPTAPAYTWRTVAAWDLTGQDENRPGGAGGVG